MTCIPFLCAKSSDTSIQHSQRADCCELAEAHSIKLYSYKELKVATNGFNASNKIGEGGFGSVYSGKLADGRMAAIKTLSSESKQGAKEFLTEILVISDVKHENLVELYGCCTEDNHRILVYNYLENGSLDRTLLGRGHSNIQFGWQTRVKICVGVAKALAYLHEEVRPHVVHRDIKASNILLDKDLTPKLSDFGLAKLFPPNLTHVSTRVAGTVGYLAPEYAIRGQLTRKADVYSYGVLLVEIVSGRCNTINGLPKEDKYILERTWKLHERKELVTMVDISLSDDFDVEQACRFLKVGLLCTQDSPKLRPSMSKALLMLKGEMEIDENTMTRPGLISDFMDSTDKNVRKAKGDVKTSNFDSSNSSTLENTTFTSAPYSHATMSFTSIYDRN